MEILRFSKGGALAAAPRGAETEIAFAQWAEGIRPTGAGFVLVLPNDADVGAIGPDLARLDAIVLEFPSFRDGRAFSQAALLRGRWGFRGEIRARGEVGRDQARFMARAGFSAFEAPAERVGAFNEALAAYSVVYQAAADASLPAFARRAPRAQAA